MSEATGLSGVGTAALAVVLLCALAGVPGVLAAQPAAGAADARAEATLSNERITNVTLSGPGTFRHEGVDTIWQSSAANLTVGVEVDSTDNTQLSVCATVVGDGTGACDSVSIRNGSGTARFVLPPQRNVSSGRHRLSVNLSTSLTLRDRVTVPVRVAEKEGDLDLDRLSNVRERELGLNMTNPDVDDDGLVDGDEVDRYGTDPTDPDTDGDGALDGVEISGASNATDPDTDDDGLEDGRELDLGLDPADPDSDDDGLEDGAEVESATDPADADSDGDGLEDGAEVDGPTNATNPDTDGDGLEDGREVELGLDPTDSDTDGDFLADGLEVTLGTSADSALVTLVKLLGVAAVAGAIAVIAGRRWSDWDPFADGSASDGDDGQPPTVGSPGAAPDTASNAASDAGSGPDPELLPPNERVEHMLAEAEGRMRQAEIVEATDWSKAKVSRTLSDMEDGGAITRFRLGRENVVTLSDRDAEDEDELDTEIG